MSNLAEKKSMTEPEHNLLHYFTLKMTITADVITVDRKGC